MCFGLSVRILNDNLVLNKNDIEERVYDPTVSVALLDDTHIQKRKFLGHVLHTAGIGQI